MRPGLAKIIEKLRIARNFENSETDLSIAGNACCDDYFDTRLSKRVHWLSKNQIANCSTTYYWCKDMVECDTGVAWATLPIRWIHLQVAQESTYSDYRPLFTTQDEWTIPKYVMEVMRPWLYWTLWMSKRHTITQHHVITLYNVKVDHTDGVMRAWAKKKINTRKTYTVPWSLFARSCPSIMLNSLQRWVCISFLHTALILSGIWDHWGNGNREWIVILRARLYILLNTQRRFCSMLTMNT